MSASRQYPKMYRIVLNSANARYTNGEFAWDINMPMWDNLHTKTGWVMGVESLFIGVSVAATDFGNIHLNELSQLLSFQSNTKANSTVLLTYNSSATHNDFVTDSVSIPITDENFFINKTLTVWFSDKTLTRTTPGSTFPFQLTLNIWRPDDYRQ